METSRIVMETGRYNSPSTKYRKITKVITLAFSI